MAGQYQISFAHSAVSDLEDVLAFYKDQKIPLKKILKEIELLSEQPDMGRMVPEFGLKNLRELIRPPFRIVYRRDIEKGRIVRIWRSERLMVPPHS